MKGIAGGGPLFAFSKPQQSWREVVSIATLNGIPIPATLLQAQHELIRSLPPLAHPCGALAFRKRPFGASAAPQGFGAHTYERVDKPEGQFFHTYWPEVIG